MEPPPIAPGLFTDGPAPRLLAGRDAGGRLVFPCPDGAAPIELGAHGTVWSATVQRFRPKSPPYAGPPAFEPFIVGYVALPELVVEARLTGMAFDAVAIGMAVVFAPVAIDTADGARRVPAFRPAP